MHDGEVNIPSRFLSFLALALAALPVGCATANRSQPLQTVPRVDLDRFMGRWNVISHVPNLLENGRVATADIYARRPDGRIDNIFVFRRRSLDAPEKRWNGVAWVTDPQSNARWKVRLFWPFTADYLILELDPDYGWAVVSNGGGDLVWVLARETSLPEDVYQAILERLRRQGLDVGTLEKVPQRPPP